MLSLKYVKPSAVSVFFIWHVSLCLLETVVYCSICISHSPTALGSPLISHLLSGALPTNFTESHCLPPPSFFVSLPWLYFLMAFISSNFISYIFCLMPCPYLLLIAHFGWIVILFPASKTVHFIQWVLNKWRNEVGRSCCDVLEPTCFNLQLLITLSSCQICRDITLLVGNWLWWEYLLHGN